MPPTNTLVSYDNLVEPFGGPEALLAKTSQAAAQVYPNSDQAAARMSQFATGLDALRVAQGNSPHVLHTPRDRMASLLQTHVANNAVRTNKLRSLLDNNNGGNLLAQLGGFFEDGIKAGKKFVWYWGHEHRCIIYDPHPTFQFHGRCVGHGGFPEPRKDFSSLPPSPEFGSQWRQLAATNPSDPATQRAPSGWILDSPNIYIPIEVADQFSPHGFMRLEFRNDKLTEFVRSPGNANLRITDLP